MTFIEQSFREFAWYWDGPGTMSANGKLTYAAPVEIRVRIDRHPRKIVTANGTEVIVGSTYHTGTELKPGGWLLASEGSTVNPATTPQPSSFSLARQILNVNVGKSFRGEIVFYSAGVQ